MGYAATFRQIVGRARPGSPIGPVAHLILHHEYGQPLPATATLAQETARLRAIDAYHRSLGWAGFGYSIMPCASGRVLEGRGYRRSGAHTGHMNRTSLAAMLPGTDTGMTDAQVDAIRAWQADGIAQGAITPDATWTGHRDHMARDCPGDRNYAQLHRLNDPDLEEDDMPTAEELADKLRAVIAQENRVVLNRVNEATRLATAATTAAVAQIRSDLGLAPDPTSDAVHVRRIREGAPTERGTTYDLAEARRRLEAKAQDLAEQGQ